MRKSIGAVIGLLAVCGVAACDSLWGTFYHCKAGAVCDVADGGSDSASGNSDWYRAASNGVRWIGMSLVPVDNSLWLIGSSGEIGFVSSIDAQVVPFSVDNVQRNSLPDMPNHISACEVVNNQITAVAIGNLSAYRFMRMSGGTVISSISGISNPDPFNAVVCKRLEGANSFVYVATSKGSDWVKNSAPDFAQAVSPIGALAVASAVAEVGSNDFWAITIQGMIAKFDGKNGPNFLSLTTSVPAGNNRVISSVDSSRAFYLDGSGDVLQTGPNNSISGWRAPGGVVLNDIYAIDQSRVLVAGSLGYVGEFYRKVASEPGVSEYRLPNQDTVKKAVIGLLPNNAGKVVYVITESGEIWKRLFP